MSWEKSLKTLNEEKLGDALTYEKSLTSSVTTSWGVDWNETYIARDLMQNFFDANRDRLSEVQVLVEGNKVTISAPVPFELVRLFYLGSEKGEADIGQYGEGFKAAAVCLLRDYNVDPIVISRDEVVYLRIDSEKVPGTQLQPVVYDFFRSSKACDGTRLILRGCSKDLIRALQAGLTHFFHDNNPLLGSKLWSSWDQLFAVYAATTSTGHVFYQRLKRGEIPDIPVVLVIGKPSARIEKKIKADRDRNAFGEELMNTFYQVFAGSGVKHDSKGQRAVVALARPCWVRGHPLLSEIADAGRFQNGWPAAMTKEVFGSGFYARSHAREAADAVQYEGLERRWREEGRQALPSYFGRFGVLNACDHTAEVKRRALEEAKAREHRPPTPAEQVGIRLLAQVLRDLAPATMSVFDERQTCYSVAETDLILGELMRKRGYRSRDVFLASRVFLADFAEALAVFLHEHTHIFGPDASRGFTDGLTELLETVVRNRKQLDGYEAKWNEALEQVRRERGKRAESGGETSLDQTLADMNETQLRQLLKRVPPVAIKRAIEREAAED